VSDAPTGRETDEIIRRARAQGHLDPPPDTTDNGHAGEESPQPPPKRGGRSRGKKPAGFKDADDRFTDARMAETVAADILIDRYMWVSGLGWLRWDQTRWVECTDVTVAEALRSYTLERFGKAVADLQNGSSDTDALDGWRQLLNAGRERAVLGLARGLVEHRAAELDADPDLLNTPAGVVDLRSLEVFPHSPDFLMTKITSGRYQPGATHSDWTAALEALDPPERAWLQIRIGQAMTGHPTPDGILLVLQGSGENGKSALTTDGAVRALGDYASMASAKLLQSSRGTEHSEEQATLRGKRFLVAEELTEARALDVTSLKRIQDVGVITARHVHQRNMTFKASHSLFTTTNYIPVVNEVDHGTWRRLALLRFPYTFRKAGEELEAPCDRRADERLKGRIKANQDGQHDAIVTWAIEGAHRWYQKGPEILAPTARVKDDTFEWRKEADRILGYWTEWLIPDPDACIAGVEMHADFNHWLNVNGHQPWPKELFGPRFIQHAETVRNRVDQVRTAAPTGLSRSPNVQIELPSRPFVYRGVRIQDPP